MITRSASSSPATSEISSAGSPSLDVPFGVEDALLREDALDESQTPGSCLAAGGRRQRHMLDDVDDHKPKLETVKTVAPRPAAHAPPRSIR